MHEHVLSTNGEIDLIVNSPKTINSDSLTEWQYDALFVDDFSSLIVRNCLAKLDAIQIDWLNMLTIEEWQKIARQKSLFGIKIPSLWIKIWRLIIKEPNLRNPERATNKGRSIGSACHIWNMWSEITLNEYSDEMDKELMRLVDYGFLYQEIGEHMLSKYGKDFWKPRKSNTKTTAAQVVNNYLYWKLPNKIARAELTAICLHKLNNEIKRA